MPPTPVRGLEYVGDHLLLSRHINRDWILSEKQQSGFELTPIRDASIVVNDLTCSLTMDAHIFLKLLTLYGSALTCSKFKNPQTTAHHTILVIHGLFPEKNQRFQF